MNATDIKSQTWITYQGAEGVMARMKNEYTGVDREYFRDFLYANTFPILNTTEINQEIQGEDLELVDQLFSPTVGWIDKEDVNDLTKYIRDKRQALLYTPKQTPKADSEKNELPPLIKTLSDAISNSGAKVTFGIQSKHIELIEAGVTMYGGGAIYSKLFWDGIGKKISWCPFTIALNYFKHLSKVDNHIGETVEEAFNRIYPDHACKRPLANDPMYKQYRKMDLEKFTAGATYRTQHPDPAMVDRILEHVAGHIDNAPTKQDIKSMRDDILNELSK